MPEVLPHYLTRKYAQRSNSDAHNFYDYPLRVGEVVQVHYPDDPTNQSKTQIEYTVNVQYRQGNRAGVVVSYRCTIADRFGGIADSVRHSFRPSSGDKENETLTDGSRVLILCPNGERNAAVIIGGVKTDKAANDVLRVTKTGQRFYDFIFNGAHFNLNDDGEVLFEVLGATKNDGSADANRDTNNHGTAVQVKKDGSFIITDKNGETITVDPTKKAIHVAAGAQDTTTAKDWTVTAGGKVALVAQGDLQLAGSTVHIGGTDASEKLVLGNKLAAALDALVNIFMANAATFILPGTPKLSPTVQGQIAAWAAQYGGGRPYLSSSKFTE